MTAVTTNALSARLRQMATADDFPASHYDLRARLGGMVMWALLVVILALEVLAPGQARAANFEYGPETEQRFVAACMVDAPRAECQCKLEGLQGAMGMEAFLDAVEAGDDRAIARGMVSIGRRCTGATAMSVPAEPATRAAEVR